jgi:glycosyltransferase involved in cell wall biosynthesis
VISTREIHQPDDVRVLRITVITATFNATKTIRRLYESLGKQSYRDFDWVVVDGLSTDGTAEFLEDIEAREDWIRVVSAYDFGVYDALNKGIALAKGQYYLVAGADDVLTTDSLLNYARAIELRPVDVVMANVVKDDRVIGGFHPRRAWIGPSRVFAGSHSLGMLLKTDLHRRFGPYSNRFPLLADAYFLKRLLRSNLVTFATAHFTAGVFSTSGMTGVNKLQILAENWQIQMLTERSPLLQTLCFIGKVLWRYKDVKEELRGNRRHCAPLKSKPQEELHL